MHGGIFCALKGREIAYDVCNAIMKQCSAVQWCKCVRVEVQEKGRGADRPLFGCQGHSGSDCCLKGSFDSRGLLGHLTAPPTSARSSDMKDTNVQSASQRTRYTHNAPAQAGEGGGGGAQAYRTCKSHNKDEWL